MAAVVISQYCGLCLGAETAPPPSVGMALLTSCASCPYPPQVGEGDLQTFGTSDLVLR